MNTHLRTAATLWAWVATSAPVFARDASAPAAPPAGPGISYARGASRDGAHAHEDLLARSLRRITGLRGLRFGADGSLSPGVEVEGGAPTARLVLGAALTSGMSFVIEDHCGSREVHFARLDAGTAVTDAAGRRKPFLLWRVHLDFEDLAGVAASPGVRAAFDPGFALLHELMHGLGFEDAAEAGAVGPIEEVLNRARLELDLPVRDRYFAEGWPVADTLMAVRLRFRTEPARDGRPRPRYEYLSFIVDSRTAAAMMDGRPGSEAAAGLRGVEWP